MHPGRNATLPFASSTWRTIVRLTIVALLCRLVIPAGYMPGPAVDWSGKLLFTLCAVSGPVGPMLTELSGEPTDSPADPASAGMDCPFGILAAQAAAPGLAPPPGIMPPAAMAAVAPTAWRTLPPLPPYGPPLGSRAPPSPVA